MQTTSSWKDTTLGSVIEKIVGGGTPSKKEIHYWNGNIPWASVKDIVTHNPLDTIDHINEEGLKKSSSRLIAANTLITPTRMALGEAVFYKVDVAINQDLKALYPKKLLDKLFLRYWFQYKKKNIKELGSGSTVAGISLPVLKKIKFRLPSIEEQKRIVKVLETWDKAIENLQTELSYRLEIKESLKSSLLSGKIRIVGYSKSWKTKTLGSFITYTSRPRPKPTSAFKALGIRSHCKGTFQKNNFDPNKIMMDTLYEVYENDLIVNITFAWEGAIAIVNKIDSGGLVSHRFPTYTFITNQGYPEFFRQFIQKKNFRNLLQSISPGGAGRNRVMSKKDFLKLKITIPDYDEQTAIAEILTTADKQLQILQSKLAKLKVQKKYLLNKLITGEIRTPEDL